ncbi:hypothetical protein SCHPADRAFT_409774 [Schizopora paradoxa]|uniref:Uncharacterized protein n=1 Tax=Schizopora paradoxa TaxID=27342 RepID=A0A0H2RL93_9AGAM|nr:hypothetical protein SCHPADRAFT_409774 [Schizopora paradoxa]
MTALRSSTAEPLPSLFYSFFPLFFPLRQHPAFLPSFPHSTRSRLPALRPRTSLATAHSDDDCLSDDDDDDEHTTTSSPSPLSLRSPSQASLSPCRRLRPPLARAPCYCELHEQGHDTNPPSAALVASSCLTAGLASVTLFSSSLASRPPRPTRRAPSPNSTCRLLKLAGNPTSSFSSSVSPYTLDPKTALKYAIYALARLRYYSQ